MQVAASPQERGGKSFRSEVYPKALVVVLNSSLLGLLSNVQFERSVQLIKVACLGEVTLG